MSGVRVLVSGIDTLHLFSRAPVRTVWLGRFDTTKRTAVNVPRGEPLPSLDIAGHALTMQRAGARTAPFRLESEHMAVLVSPNAPQNLPTATVELRALYLWQRGAAKASSEAQFLVDEFTTPTLQHELQVSRVDFAVDFQGWVPSPMDRARVVTRAERRTTHELGQRFTGFSFGHNDVVARLYDKTEEIRKSDKAWFYDVWRKSPAFREGEHVWRLEYQLRRDALRKLWVQSTEGSAGKQRLESWLDVLDLARGLWRYLAGRWLTMRMPRTRETRQVLTAEWGDLLDQGFSGPLWNGTDADLYRQARQVAAARTEAAFAGYLARQLAEFAHLTRQEPSLGSIPALVTRAQLRLSTKGTSLLQRAETHVEAWRKTRESMRTDNAPKMTETEMDE